MRKQKFDLALQNFGLERHIEIRPFEIAIPLGYFVLEDKVIAERVGRQHADLAMILMHIVPSMGEYDVRIDPCTQLGDALLDEAALVRKETVLELSKLNFRGRGAREEGDSCRFRFGSTRT